MTAAWAKLFRCHRAVAVICLISACTTSDKVTNSSYRAPTNPALAVDSFARPRDLSACVPKDYPHDARAQRQTGRTVISLLINTDGQVVAAKISQSSGWPLLDDATLAAFSNPACTFYPIMVNGQNVEAWRPLAYVWKLE